MARNERAISGPLYDLIGEVVRQRVSDVRIRKVNESGLFARLLKANVGEVDIDAFERLLGLQGPPSPMRIVRNYFESINDAKEILRMAGCYATKWANEMIEGFEPFQAASMGEISIAIVSNEWLGLTGDFTYGEVLAKGAERNLIKCAPNDALMLRLKYLKQPYGEHIRVAMDPIPDAKGNPSIFRLENTDEDGLAIDGVCGHPDRRWPREKVHWAFVNINR